MNFKTSTDVILRLLILKRNCISSVYSLFFFYVYNCFITKGGLKDIGDWLKDSGKKIVDWRVWKDMGNFFDKVGNWLGDATKNVINWGGFDDMRNFFSGIYIKFLILETHLKHFSSSPFLNIIFDKCCFKMLYAFYHTW